MSTENHAGAPELLTDEDAARYLDVSVATLRSWRLKNRRNIGKPPPFVKIGRLVRYRRADLDRWIESNVHG